jgi:hypothetical protein
VDISAALAADLAILTQALDADVDLEVAVRAFTADLRQAVASYLAMTITIVLDGRDLSFTVHDAPAPHPIAATSLLIPLAAVMPTDTASTMLLYAAAPGAFVDLAADLSHALDIEPGALVLDGHLDRPADSDGLTGLDEHIAINQAIGILIARGHTPEAAEHELRRLAALDHASMRDAAVCLIRSAGTEPSDSPSSSASTE